MDNKFVSRAGEKLEYAIKNFELELTGLIAADFGSSTGGFVDCLLQNGVSKVYSVDTSYGELAWTLRKDPRVVVMERTNAMHINLPEKADVITVDTAWTKQVLTVPNALANLKEDGFIISLIKPHYEAPKKYLQKGRLQDEFVEEVLEKVKNDIVGVGGVVKKMVESPIVGEKGKNREFLALIFNGSYRVGGS
jgi:23S rRNA (cytidine1920-2'-O)/16S rRNA (cytidine1409-2'-O)-methyltransferase